MLSRLMDYFKRAEQEQKIVYKEGKWRALLSELYIELDIARRENNALKDEVARLRAICDCQAELLAERGDNG